MENLQLVLDLALGVIAAFVGGAIAQRLGQPVILGYLVGGMVIGPFTPGPVAEYHSVGVLAEIGVAFLMFALGAEFSLGELRRMGKIASLGGVLQIGATMLLGPLVAPFLGLSLAQGVFLGALFALSSTVVALKTLMARGELQSLHGRAALGILIAQDLAVVPMVVALPALAGGSPTLGMDLLIAAAKAGGIMLGAYLIGARAAPWLLRQAAVAQTRELFLLGVVGLALGTALVTQAAGLSLAFGAFLAGLVVGESEFRTQVVAEILPLRDLFASLFFVSVGMLINPLTLWNQAGPVALIAAVVIIGKTVIVTVIALALKLPGRVALLTALSLAQVGEFSFVLARVGVDRGVIPASLFDLILACSLVSIVLTPALLRAAPAMLRLLERLPGVGRAFAPPLEAAPEVAGLTGHTVICGFGRVGHELADALEAQGRPYLVIEYNPLVVEELRRRGAPVIYGDASSRPALEHARLDSAAMMAVLLPDIHGAEMAVREARAMQPDLYIIARAENARQVEELRRAGASDVVQPEFEAGVEVLRHTLRRYGITEPQLGTLAEERRSGFYHAVAASGAE
jgi:monovalent cation:H+ antiporter-2, CPA2 family